MMQFEDLNPYSKLEYLEAQGAEELKSQLHSIKTPIRIVSMYSVGARHIVWFLTQDKINKIKKDKSNGSSSKI